ncbi:MAG: prepilin-type N-terminal cleavage/methylation domain-containing protein, partial [Candidatus Eremiobacteraeota bacterium]|nr:prepilin-type N-terminal cleavage/methylation domain-containing protein [Candidatus Eremiobacteraeota bacterium]
MDSQRGFTLLETMAALGIVSLLLLAGLRLATLARAPGATANAAAQLDAAIALARSLARASGNGATLLMLPRPSVRGAPVPGFRIVLYRGRPSAAGAATLARELPLVADASLREASLGAPPFAVFFRSDGTAVGSAHPVLAGTAADPQFAPIAAEPPCPSAAGIVLEIERNGATETRAIPCPAAPNASVAAPQPSMTPNPPTFAPRSLLFHWPSAPTEWFSIAEFGYRRWFAATGGAMQGFACIGGGAAVVAFPSAPPYSGPQSAADAQSSPAPPNAPYAYAVATSNAPGAMDDAPAHFPVLPVGAGLCSVPLVDAFAQRSDPWGNPLVVTMQVMGRLTLAAGSGTATSQTAPLAAGALTQGKSLTITTSKTFDNDPSGIVFSPVSWSAVACGSALTFTASGNNTAGSGPTGTATHSFVITDSTPPSSALTCTGTVSDQYGEPAVAFTVNVAAAASGLTMATWPAVLQVGMNGDSLGQSGSAIADVRVPQPGLLASLPTRMSPWLNQLLDGGVASACVFCHPTPSPISTSSPAPSASPTTTPTPTTSPISVIPGPCYAKALTSLTSSSPDLTLANMPTAEYNALLSALGVGGLAVDSNNCIDELNIAANAWEPAPKFGALVYEPNKQAKSFNIMNGTTCNGSTATLGPWEPSSRSGTQALLTITGGSSGGSCNVSLTDGTTTQAVADAGLVGVSTIGFCPQNDGTLPIGQSCFPYLPSPPNGNPMCGAGGSESGPVVSGYTGAAYYKVTTSPTTGVIAPITTGTFGQLIGYITRIGP